MTNFDKLKNMTIEELARFINNHGMIDNTPWMEWWDKRYCDKCESITVKYDHQNDKLGFVSFRDEIECSYCELEHKCKYFPDLEDTPDTIDIIEMWLEAEND